MTTDVLLRQQTGKAQGREIALIGVTILGRNEDATLVVEDGQASRRHAELRPDGNGWQIVDLGSTNKTFLNDIALTPNAPTSLRDGNLIRIGNTIFCFVQAYSVAPVAEAAEPPTAVVPLKTVLVVGRDANCDLVLDEPQVSRRHCQIVQRENRSWLEDLDSRNGTYLNGVRVAVPEPLAEGAEIRIGLNRFVFRNNTLEHFDQNGAVRIDVTDLNHTVQKSGKPLQLLHDIGFVIPPKEFVAIVGSSGAGKSTLLKALTGFSPASEGSVRLNGVEFYTHLELFRNAIGYVPQDDIVHRELTVTAVLRYAAQLRLPPDTTPAEIERLIETTLTELKLTHRKDAFVRDLSGGELKRVNVAVEMLAKPSLLFLDEPTSGLDPGMELDFVELVKRMTAEGRTIVVVTHAVSSMEECDKLLFLARGGYIAFYGPPEDALTFFEAKSYADIYRRVESQTPEQCEQNYRKSEAYRRYIAEPNRNAPKHKPGETMTVARSLGAAKRKASGVGQFRILLQRYLDTLRGDGRNLALLLAQSPIIALLLMAVFPSNVFGGNTGSASVGFSASKASLLLFCMVVSALLFGIVNAAREITKESAIYKRERLINLRPVPYLLSKVGVLSALCVVQTALLFGILRLKIDFHLASGKLPGFLLTLLLANLCGMMLGLAISSLAKTNDQAMSLVPVAVLPQIIFSGLIEMESLDLVRKLMPSYWAYGALGNLTNLNAIMRFPNPLFDIRPETAWLALLGIGMAYFLASLWFLRRKDKQ